MNWIFIFSLLPCCPISTFTVSKISYFSYFPESIFPFLASFITTFTLFHQRGKDRFSQLFGKKIQTTLKFWDFLTRILHNHLHCQFVKTSGRIFWHLKKKKLCPKPPCACCGLHEPTCLVENFRLLLLFCVVKGSDWLFSLGYFL